MGSPATFPVTRAPVQQGLSQGLTATFATSLALPTTPHLAGCDATYRAQAEEPAEEWMWSRMAEAAC